MRKAFLISFFVFLISGVFVLILVLRLRNKMITPVENTEQTRKAAVSGSFYPADSEELNRLIDGFLGQTKVLDAEGDLKILIVPHAGLEYSGQAAAWGFKQLSGKKIERVILLGVSHTSWFDYAAVFNEGNWETPLGKTAVAEDLAKILLGKKIISDEKPHRQEHSLEVELVFLQKVLTDFKIVPILLGQVSPAVIDELAEKISQNLNENTLLVVSSDLSHYPSWELANQADNEVIGAITGGKSEVFEEKIKQIESQNYPGLETCACGNQAISVGLKVAEILGTVEFKKIAYENSGDITGDKSRVVGYAAIGGWIHVQDILDLNAQKEALSIARKTLGEYLKTNKVLEIIPREKVLERDLGAFVTLKRGGQLRGCIGLFEPEMSLYKVIQEMVVAAATEDSRFLPVTEKELKDINIEISVMTPKRQIDDWRKIELGKHGVVVQKDFRSGTFLPQVATETGWSKEEFLSQLCSQKAGLAGDCYKDPSVNLFIFEAQVFGEH